MIEIPILTPRVRTATQEPVGNSPVAATVTQETVQHQLEMLQYENQLMKEDAWELREELEIWKDASRKKPARGQDTLAKYAIQFEVPVFIQEK